MYREKFGKAFRGDPQSIEAAGAARGDERLHQLARDFVVVEISGRQHRVVQFVGVAWIGALFVANALDRRSVENSGAARRDHVGATLFERRVIEKRERR